MEHRSLQHPLKAQRRLRISPIIGVGQKRRSGVDKLGQLSAKVIQINLAGLKHCYSSRVVEQREQQMLDRDEFMAPGSRGAKRLVERILKLFAQHSVSPLRRRLTVPPHTVADVHCRGHTGSPAMPSSRQYPEDIFHIRPYPAYGPPA